MSARLHDLHEAGVSIWIDYLSRPLVRSGRLGELMRDCAVTGLTSNPTIFAKSIVGTGDYDEQLRSLARHPHDDGRELFFALALDDVADAARVFEPVFERSEGRDGYASFECTPDLADDAEATIEQATELWQRLARRNVMIKVPATDAGLVAIEELTRRGLNVNVTLLFGVRRYRQVIEAYMRGLAARLQDGEPLDGIASVASFFVSRVDAKADALLPEGSPLRGRVAIANARLAYRLYRSALETPLWQRLAAAGARPQRPLWASTGTKNPAYSDVLYVSELIGPDVINTMPRDTLHAFADHGEIAPTLFAGGDQEVVRAAAEAGVDLDAIASELEREGVRAFSDSYDELLGSIAASMRRAAA